MESASVYILELDYEINAFGGKGKIHSIDDVYEDLDDAVKAVMENADSDVDEASVYETMEELGEVELWWHPMMIGNETATHIFATLTERTVIKKSKA